MQGSSSMSIAAEQAAGRQRLRERLRAITPETTLAVSGLVAIAIHVLHDNFFPPQPRASPLDYRVRGPVPVAVVSVAAARSSSSRWRRRWPSRVTPLFDRSVKEDRHE